MFSAAALEDLYAYMEDIHQRERDLYVKKNLTDTELTLANVAACAEEFGEFMSAVRCFAGLCYSQKKIDAVSHDDVLLEGMDVLITTLLLMKKHDNGNLDKYLYDKIGKNQARGY